jgi:hypothetical protein
LNLNHANGFELEGTDGIVKFTGEDDTLVDIEWSLSYKSSQTSPYTFTLLTEDLGQIPSTSIDSLTFAHYSSSTAHNFNMSGRSIIKLMNNQLLVIACKGPGNVTLSNYSLTIKEV